jgi:hypothetical protein
MTEPSPQDAVAIAPTLEQVKASEVATQVASIVTQAQAIEVRTPQEAAAATEFLSQIATAKRKAEDARTYLVKPLNDHVKAINARFKEQAKPLDEADGVVRGKVLAFRREEEDRQRAEQKRIDAERRERERQAEEERRRAQEEAARAAREAEAAEAARLAQIAAEADAVRQRVAALSDDELAQLALVTDDDEPELRQAIDEEFTARHAAREAQERAAAALEAENAARAAEVAAKSQPALTVAAPVPLRGTSGSASTRKRWKAEVIDEAAVPRQFLVVDTKAINAAVRDGVREIPGVRIEQVDELSVRAAS